MRATYSIVAVTASLTALLAVQSIHAQTPAASASDATLTAKLIDPEKKAAMGWATVEVTTSGVALTDPAISNEKPVPGQGHLHYQVDQGPVVATPSAKLSYHDLTPGPHTIVVMLVGNDHKPLGPQQKLTVTVPRAGMAPKPTSTSGTVPAPSSTPATAQPGH